MPDEEVATAVADTKVEPGPSTGSEAEDAETKLTDLEAEGEVEVQPEQEAEAEKPEPEQEAEQETSFAERLEAAKPQLEELKEADPEQYEQLTKVFGGDDVAAKTAALEQREAGMLAAAESQQAFGAVQSAYEPDREGLRTRVTAFGNAVAQTINKAAQDAGGQATTSGPRVAAAIQEQGDKAENMGRATGMADSFLEARTAALTSTLGSQLTAEELTVIGGLTWPDAVTNPRETYGKLFDTMFKAAVRAAPAEAVKAGVDKSEKTAKAAELLEKLTKTLPKNGKAQTAVSAGASSKPTTIDEIDEALRTGPTADIDTLLKRRAALIG